MYLNPVDIYCFGKSAAGIIGGGVVVTSVEIEARNKYPCFNSSVTSFTLDVQNEILTRAIKYDLSVKSGILGDRLYGYGELTSV